jgi:hypothetical protein
LPQDGSPPPTTGQALPGVTVTAPYTRSHGGYVVSGDFLVDARMPTVVFPAQPLVKDDILSVQPVHLNDDEYLVLQECASADCRQAHVVQVWNAGGAVGRVHNGDGRVWIAHENKYFLWMQRMPVIQRDCALCASRFQNFQSMSPPMTLIPVGQEVSRNRAQLQAQPPVAVPVTGQAHEGATFVLHFEGGAVVRVRRMHAAR